MVKLQLLGPTALSSGTTDRLEAILAGPKRVALLAYLAAARPFGFHRRDILLGLLWADADQVRARATLRSTLRALRGMLGPGVLVNRGDEELRLNSELLQCDVWTFESELARGNRRAALEEYDGDLLHGFHVPNASNFACWLERERLQLRERARTAASELSNQLQTEGDLVSALAFARRGLALDRSDERLVCQTMQLLDAQGDRTGALRAYQELETVLRREYDLEPSPATRALRDSIVRPTRHTANHVQDTTPGRTAPPDIPPPRAGCLPHVEARRLYTEGRFFWSKRSQTALERAVECFTQATSHVRTFAQAYAGLADAYQSLAAYGYLPHSQALPKATAAAECALALDDSLVDAHTSLAGVMALAGDAAGADDRYRRALRSNPTYVPALHWYATFLRQHGQTEAAYKYSRRAMALDPLWAVVTFTVGTILRGKRKYDEAIKLCCRATELDPSYAPAWYFLACTYAQVGRADHAVKCATRSVTLGGETSLYLGGLGYVLARTGQPQAALRTLDALGQTDANGAGCNDRALVYVGLGETDCAVECLERAHASGRPVPREPLTDPIFDPLRCNTRFQRLAAKRVRMPAP